MDPASVAIVGASTDETKRGYQVIETLQNSGYGGDIYPVNPYATEIRGLKVYSTVSAIPARVDLALVVTPAEVVPEVLADCGESGLAGAIVVAVGFRESDEQGRQLEREIVSMANENGIRLIGPNTSGMINVHRGLNLVGTDQVPAGNLALLCQSGNIAISLFTEAASRQGIGFSHYVGVGNEADLKFHEYLSFLGADEETGAIICYIEGMSDGRAFLRASREVSPNTPIIALTGGKSDVGKRSASSHTGSLAADADVSEAVFKQAGVISVDRSDELLAVAHALSSLPPAEGVNVGILSDGGGHATIAADALIARGLSVPPLTDETQQRLQEILPDPASIRNPVDVAGGTDDDPRIFTQCADLIGNDPNVNALLLTGLFGGYGIRFAEQYTAVEVEVAETLGGFVDKYGIPLVVQSAYESFDTAPHSALRRSGIPVVESIDVAAASLTALTTYGQHCATIGEKSDFQNEATGDGLSEQDRLDRSRTQLSEYDTKLILEAESFPIVPFELATTPDEAQEAAEKFTGPVAMKLVSPDIVHKSEAGGIALGVSGAMAIARAYDDLLGSGQAYDPDAAIDGVLVSPMREPGVELIVGVVGDTQFGPVLMVGLGGVFVEVLGDVAFRALPVTETDARSMLADITAQELLDGARGDPPVDRDAVVELLSSVSAFVEANPAVVELDLNPVFATDEGVEIIDATMRIEGGLRSVSDRLP